MNVAGGSEDIRSVVDAVYREESRHILATLIRLLGDFDMAEEALQGDRRTTAEGAVGTA